MGNSLKSARFLIDSRLADAARGSADAAYELGMVYSSGAAGIDVDLIEAHKWFNIAAASGDRAAAQHRDELAREMTREEVAAALRAARDWVTHH